jgi:hypothetical protein
MNLTSAQRTTLAADINGQASLAAARTTHDAPAVAAFYAGTGAVNVWRNDVSVASVIAVIGMSEFVGLTAIKQNGLILLTQAPVVDATQATVRAGFASIFAAGATLTALNALAIRAATKFEALFTNGAAVNGSFLMQNDGNLPALTLLGQALDPATVALAMGW